jgi:hypothetical protein
MLDIWARGWSLWRQLCSSPWAARSILLVGDREGGEWKGRIESSLCLCTCTRRRDHCVHIVTKCTHGQCLCNPAPAARSSHSNVCDRTSIFPLAYLHSLPNHPLTFGTTKLILPSQTLSRATELTNSGVPRESPALHRAESVSCHSPSVCIAHIPPHLQDSFADFQSIIRGRVRRNF